MIRTRSSLMLLVLLILCCTVAAGEDSFRAPAAPSDFPWERNVSEHWQLRADGSRTKAGKHKLDKNNVCRTCESEVWVFEDGAADVSDYNKYGDLVRYTSFAGDGSIDLELTYTYEYDREGNILMSWEYVDGVLAEDPISPPWKMNRMRPLPRLTSMITAA